MAVGVVVYQSFLDTEKVLYEIHLSLQNSEVLQAIEKARAVRSTYVTLSLLALLGLSLIAGVTISLFKKPFTQIMQLVKSVRADMSCKSMEVTDGAVAELDQIIDALEWVSELSKQKGVLEEQLQAEIKKYQDSESRLTEAKDERSNFLAIMNHEIRTPVNGLLGMLHLVDQASLNDKQGHYIRSALHSGNRLVAAIDDILDFSRLSEGKITLDNVSFDPVNLLEEVAFSLSEQIHQNGLELTVHLDSDTPLNVLGDPARIRQVMTNLINNAIKFTNRGVIGLSLSLQNGQINFSVSDTGVGMTDEEKKAIFTAFTQVEKGFSRRYGGLGLGLSICHGLITAMNGKLEVNSDKGVGSVFHFSIPTVEVKGEERECENLPDLSQLQVLVVEEQQAPYARLLQILESLGIDQVDRADNGDDALEDLELSDECPYDLIFMASNVSGLSGTELVAAIRATPFTAVKHDRYIVELTNREQVERAAGVDARLEKPIKQSDLYNCLRKFYSKDNDRLDQTPTDTWWFGGQRLLLVEDDIVNQEVASEFLRNAGFIVDVEENGERALETVKVQSYDVIVMDIQMPVMDGFTAAKAIRKLGGSFETVPIIALSANVLEGDREKSAAAGMNAHLSKPIDVSSLISELAKWITRSSRPMSSDSLVQESGDLSMPDLPGIDTVTPLKRLAGKVDVYQRILMNFKKRYVTVITELETLIRQGDMADAYRLAHTLKGSSGNIGAMEVYQTACLLENLCKDEETTRALLEVKTLKEVLGTVLDGLALVDTMDMGDDANHTAKRTEPFDKEHFNKLLVELNGLLDDDLRAAGKALKSVRAMAVDMEYSERLSKVEEAMNGFDIDSAKSMLGNIKA